MPSSTLVVACVVGLALLVVLLVLRSRNKSADAAAPRFEPPRELAQRPAKEPAKDASPASTPAAEAKEARHEQPRPPSTPPPRESTQKLVVPPEAFPAPTSPAPIDEEDEKTSVEPVPPSTEEVGAEQILDAHSTNRLKTPAMPTAPPPLPRSESKPTARPRMPSYSDISDESVAPETPEAPEAPEAVAEASPAPEPPLPDLSASEPRLAVPKPAEPKLPVSEPRVAAARPLPTSSPRVPVVEPKLPVSEPRVAAAKPLPSSEARVPAAKVATSEPNVPAAKPADDHDWSALNEAPRAKAATAAATVAKFAPPANPATADLEKNDPRHAAARRLARVSVSEIKLYHEDEVKAGREAKDLWKRLSQDIGLAKQTFEARVVAEVRDRFDYLLDEIIRQLAEGDASKLGPDAPKMKGTPDVATATHEASTSAAVTAPPPPMDVAVETEAPTKTAGRTLEAIEAAAQVPVAKIEPEAAKPEPRPTAKVEPEAPKPAEAKAADGKPSGVATRGIPPNPETAELEKNDPRHAAARRLARLSVSEIKLYHEDEVKAGREAKDLWKRMITDIGLAMQTYDKRVDKEVRDRFDYLYDEILRQLAEGDVAKLGPEAPKKSPAAAAPAQVSKPEAVAKVSEPKLEAVAKVSEPKVAVAKAPEPKAEPVAKVSEPKLEAVAKAPEPVAKVSELKLAVAAPAAAAPAAPVPATPGGAAARYLPPSNPATAELEKNDPRHAAARRLARLSVSEIKLYHEDEVKAGREAKDLWKRLITDIGLATQTFEKRVDKEVRERFDYLYDEILRQLAEGDVAKLGAEAPKPKA